MKQNKFQFKMSLLLMALLATFQFSVTSCSDDDSSGGAPRITSVTNTDPDNQIEYTKAGTGSLLVIRGENLGHTMKVFINDQEVWFNPTMNTNHSIIVQVPSEGNGFVLTAFDSTLKDEIRVETKNGTATYAFKITAPYPSASRVQCRYPRSAGDVVTVVGKNLVDIERIFITDLTIDEIYASDAEEIGGNRVEVTQFEITKKNHQPTTGTAYETESELTFTIPEMSFTEGTLVIQCAAGNVLYPFSLYLPAPTITGVSTDMPVFGESVVVTGTDFIQVDEVKIGDKVLAETDYTIAESEAELTIVFSEAIKPSVGSDALLSITTGGGTATIPFYDYSTLLTSFNKDDAGNFIDAANNGWGPDAEFVTETADGVTGDGVFAHIYVPEEAQQWWGTMVYFRKDWNGNPFPLPGFDVIPANASADEVYLAMEVYNQSDYNKFDGDGIPTFTGYLRYMIEAVNGGENQYDIMTDWVDGGYPTEPIFDGLILADINGKAPVGQWYRHVLPLSKFGCYAGKTYADIVSAGLNQFRIQSINQGTVTGKVDVCIDNVRIFYQKKQ